MSEDDCAYILGKWNAMNVVYNPKMMACGFAPQFQDGYIDIGPLTFTGKCCLAATIAHEANHLGRNVGDGRGTEMLSEYIENKSFGCKPSFGAPR